MHVMLKDIIFVIVRIKLKEMIIVIKINYVDGVVIKDIYYQIVQKEKIGRINQIKKEVIIKKIILMYKKEN